MGKKLTTEEFIEKARNIHGDKYDYSKVEYIGYEDKVCIICHKHGEFWQMPMVHLKGSGCPKCRSDKMSSLLVSNTDKFIEKARNIHGDKYDYSKVEYIGCENKVCVICPEHGEFWIKPSKHIGRGDACPTCGKQSRVEKHRKTLDYFMDRFIEKHGYKYDYSKSIYITQYTPITITCKECGRDFQSTPFNHARGGSCPYCVTRRQYTQDEIITKFKDIHGDKYDYSKVEYKTSHDKVCIICPEHGEFWQRPETHLKGQGCFKCGKINLSKTYRKKYTTKRFIERANKIHGDKYDYSNVNYTTCEEKVCIICPKHGEFWMTPNNHLHGKGCSKCADKIVGDLLRKTLEQFIEEARKIHGDKYDYSRVEYTGYKTKVCIICPIHGEFWQIPMIHLKGCGCPMCNNSKLETDIDNYLNDNNITHEQQKTFDWLKYKKLLKLDFYIPQYNVAVECQGVQHFEEVDIFGGKRGLKATIKRDILKKQLCEQHGIKLLYYADEKPTNWDKYEVITDKEILLKEIKGD